MALLIITIAIALLFDFINGFHDAANSIATIVSTRVLKPHYAVMWAAFFNLIAFLFFKLHVANTIGTGIVDPSIINTSFMLAALLGAIFWNIFTWFFGIPSSSSHALIGGLVGAGIAKAGVKVLVFSGLFKVIVAIVLSPILGWFLGLLLMLIITRIVMHSSPGRINDIFKKLQFVSAALISLGHGGNDAQKTMGIIAVLLFSEHYIGPNFYVPLWVVLSCNVVIALGTLMGGWRIVKTMGMRITKLRPINGFCAETGGALTLFLATFLGIPVSTTHTITGSIIGVGVLHRFSAVRWGVAHRIIVAWIVTIPAAACVAAVAELILLRFVN